MIVCGKAGTPTTNLDFTFKEKKFVMNSYHNISKTTGEPTPIKGYDFREDSITIFYKDGSVHYYTRVSCGKDHIENMKKLALAQRGLNTYITENNLSVVITENNLSVV